MYCYGDLVNENFKEAVYGFLLKMRSSRKTGFYRYSLTGDIHNEGRKWGLGNSAFALKIYYTLGFLGRLESSYKSQLVTFMNCFKNHTGVFCDPLVKRIAWRSDLVTSLRSRDFGNAFHRQTERAETRQAVSSLRLIGVESGGIPHGFPTTTAAVIAFLEKLDWQRPWSAGSHFSHLLFFLEGGDVPGKERLIDVAISWINGIQDENSGAWFKGKCSAQQKINGAMKVITGLKAARRLDFPHGEKLIDLCLAEAIESQACDHFNIIFVLNYAHLISGAVHRRSEIQDFAAKRLGRYFKHYWPEHGGFSFYEGCSNDRYYGARITRGLPEPDIHGTVLFLWGLSIIGQLLECGKELNEFTA